ncbi:hypothetical protein AB0465_19320 [Streptomyces griseoviridis]|uniref:hypothetical protein n=1 Tax=Streptomyces griseoviridis TaxID=45398 RepID=UPI0034501AB5
MEQRIGSSSQPLEGAGFDPAFIPGLTSPSSAGKATGKPTEAETEAEAAQDTEEEHPEDVSSEDGSRESDVRSAVEPEEPVEPEDAVPAGDEAVEGPVFEASDRRARIVADHRGVRLSLDDQACEFRWDEIGAVETESPRFGKRFTITVHTPDRRWYPIEIEAKSRARFDEWDRELDAVLDTYFEDGAAETEPDSGPEPDSETGADPAAEDGPEAEVDAGEGESEENAKNPANPANPADSAKPGKPGKAQEPGKE